MRNTNESRRPMGRRVLFGLLQAMMLLALVHYLVLPRIGLRLVRVANGPDLSGSEIERVVRSAPADQALELPGEAPRNVILLLVDGIGFSHLAAARSAFHGIAGEAPWDRFPVTGWVHVRPATGWLTDSGASATAYATGVPTRYGALGVDRDGEPLETLFEVAQDRGFRTGIVTDSYVWDATPAAFVTHTARRDDARSILEQLADSKVEIFVGELEDLGEGEVPEWDESVVILERGFRVYGPDPEGTERFLSEAIDGPAAMALYEEDQVNDLNSTPTLPPHLEVALDRLSSDERPFLLLVETEEPDSASHRGDTARMLKAMEVVGALVETLLDFAAEHPDTLLVFTSDHETGGLALTLGDRYNASWTAVWATGEHTGSPVPLFATGPGAEVFGGVHTNWQIGRLLKRAVASPAPSSTDVADAP